MVLHETTNDQGNFDNASLPAPMPALAPLYSGEISANADVDGNIFPLPFFIFSDRDDEDDMDEDGFDDEDDDFEDEEDDYDDDDDDEDEEDDDYDEDEEDDYEYDDDDDFEYDDEE